MVFWRITTAITAGVVAVSAVVTRNISGQGTCKSQRKLDGKVAFITGANAGIGKETAKDLVNRGARVYLACRSEERARNAVNEIITSTGKNKENVQFIKLDLASLESVRTCAREFKQREKKLDILVNNAGVNTNAEDRTIDGIDFTFGVNHLAPFLLTHLLMDSLFSAGSSRIVNVTSTAHNDALPWQWDTVRTKNNPKVFTGFRAYAQSKLANILFTRELASRIEGTNVHAYSVHPGVVRTGLASTLSGDSDIPFTYRMFMILTWPLLKDARAGAQTVIFCAVDESIVSENGTYYADCKEGETSEAAKSEADAQTLWDISLDLVNLSPADIHPKLC